MNAKQQNEEAARVKRVTRVLPALLCMIDADGDLVNLVVGFLVLGGRLQEPFEPTNAVLRQAR